MKFFIIQFNEIFFISYKTALHMAVEKEKLDIIQLLLNCPNLNVNLISISNQFIF